MRTTLTKLAAMLLLCSVAIFPCRAQSNTPIEAEPATRQLTGIEKQKMEADKDLEKTRLDNEKDIQKTRMDNDKDLEKTRLDNEKQMANTRSDNQRSMIHDLAWNSWVLFAIAIFFFGYLRDKRRHETIRLMVEKGTPITPELLDGLRKKKTRANYDPHGYLCWGVTLVLVGVALMVAFHGGAHMAGWIVLAVGMANLILWFIDRANSNGGQAK